MKTLISIYHLPCAGEGSEEAGLLPRPCDGDDGDQPGALRGHCLPPQQAPPADQGRQAVQEVDLDIFV